MDRGSALQFQRFMVRALGFVWLLPVLWLLTPSESKASMPSDRARAAYHVQRHRRPSTSKHAQRYAASASSRQFVPILVMHHVKPLKPSDDAIERGLTLLPAQFDAEMAYLVRSGYHTVSMARLVASLRSGPRLPAKSVVLTFDDGYNDVYPNVYKVLRRDHLTATFFIVPGFLNTSRYLTWSEVIDMSRHGMDIEAHSMTHPDLTTVHGARLWYEISNSRSVLRDRLHKAVQVFAYPYGAYNAEVLRDLSRAGFLAAVTTHQGWWQSRGALYTMPRVYVDLDDSLSIFAGRLRADPMVLAEDVN